jgi:hypothetical protein
MLTISKALSAGQAQTYHSREFASEQQNYWSRERQAHSEWRGALRSGACGVLFARNTSLD